VAYLKIIQDAPLFLAIKNGYFTQEGLTITPVVETASVQALAGMVRGTIDVNAGANYVNFFQLQASGTASIKVIAPSASCNEGSNVVMALKSSGIKSDKDLVGKTVAVQINPDIQTLTLNAILASEGIDYHKVHYTTIPFPNMNAALAAHRVDAISQVPPFTNQAEAQDGAIQVVSQCKGPTANLPQAGYMSTAAWAAKYPNTAKAFQRAIEKAQSLATSNPAAVASILPTFIPITPQLASKVDFGLFPSTFDSAALQKLADMMTSAGMIKGSLNVSPLLFSGG
jgi:NitT/TauT family transport system substrate-binding protein